MLPPAKNAVAHKHGARRGPHRGTLGIGVHQSVRHKSRTLPTRPRCGDIAVGQPGAGPHVPRGCREKITRRFEMFGDQGGILISRRGVAPLQSPQPGTDAVCLRSDFSCDS